MNLSSLTSPLKRHTKLSLLVSLFCAAGIFFLAQSTLSSHQTTLYTTVSATGQAPNGDHRTSAEGAEKIAETVSGWVKDPAFRQAVLTQARSQEGNEDLSISSFKRKVTARQQNRLNVFFTLSLSENEAQWSSAISQAIEAEATTRLKNLNTNAAYEFTFTPFATFTETEAIPVSWLLFAAILTGLILGFLAPYVVELLTGVLSFPEHATNNMLLDTPVLELTHPDNQEDQALLKAFLSQFEDPALIPLLPEGTHTLPEPSGPLTPDQTAVLAVRLGTTTATELRNALALYGEDSALVLFTR